MEKGLPEGEPLNHRLINRSIEKAQQKVEERNFDIRKHLLEYDDVLNEQRKVIFRQRDDILDAPDLVGRVLNTAVEILESSAAEYLTDRGKNEAAFLNLLEQLKQELFFVSERDPEGLAKLQARELVDSLAQEMERNLREKAEIAGPERFNLAVRFEYLRNIDNRWQDHLENLEALREAVYLRSYAQQNPLLEYKLEGFQIFDELIHGIRTSVAKKLFAIKAETLQPQRFHRAPAARTTELHSGMQMIGGGAAAAAAAAGGSPAATAGGGGTATATAAPGGAAGAARPSGVVTRGMEKVGRNDPCPCGSGKKYKHCHGRG